MSPRAWALLMLVACFAALLAVIIPMSLGIEALLADLRGAHERRLVLPGQCQVFECEKGRPR